MLKPLISCFEWQILEATNMESSFVAAKLNLWIQYFRSHFGSYKKKKKKKKHLYIIWLLLQCACRLNMFETSSWRGIYSPSALWTCLHTTAVRESYIPKREHKWEYICIPTQNRITRAHKWQTEVTPKATRTQINLNTCQIPQCTQMII